MGYRRFYTLMIDSNSIVGAVKVKGKRYTDYGLDAFVYQNKKSGKYYLVDRLTGLSLASADREFEIKYSLRSRLNEVGEDKFYSRIEQLHKSINSKKGKQKIQSILKDIGHEKQAQMNY